MFIKIIYRASQFIGTFATVFLTAVLSHGSDPALVVVYPEEYSSALRNPLKGFRPDLGGSVSKSRFATLARHYIKWNDLEQKKTARGLIVRLNKSDFSDFSDFSRGNSWLRSVTFWWLICVLAMFLLIVLFSIIL